MTAERAQAYRRVLDLLEELGPGKLHADEQERVRACADTLLFAAERDLEAVRALDDIDDLAMHLVESGRWEEETAERLAALVAACGPDRAPAHA